MIGNADFKIKYGTGGRSGSIRGSQAEENTSPPHKNAGTEVTEVAIQPLDLLLQPHFRRRAAAVI